MRRSESSLCLSRLWSELQLPLELHVLLCDMIGPQTLVFIVSHSSRGANICSGSNVSRS